jgi:hypothetical protein
VSDFNERLVDAMHDYFSAPIFGQPTRSACQVIPDAAVEAAARALWHQNEHDDEWATEFPTYKDYLRAEATKALEAAAPFMVPRG